jgi:hypothetical protein
MSFYENWDDSHIYWTTAYRIGPTVSIASRSRDMSHFYAFAGVPVLTLVSRPDAIIDYKVVDPTFTGIVSRLHQDLTLTSVHRYFAPTVGVGYAMGKGSGELSSNVVYEAQAASST